MLAPLFDPQPWSAEFGNLSARGWFAVAYNVFLAGTLAHWAWFTLARTLPVAVSSLSSLPVPVVGVISGILLLGERPGPQEWLALALVVTALFVVLFPPSRRRGVAIAARAARMTLRQPVGLQASSGISVSTLR